MITIDEAAVWSVPLQAESATVENLSRWLSPEEKYRAGRFVTQELTRRFTVCRGVLRFLLSQFVERSPEELQFQYGQWGKPSLVGSQSLGLHFNVSHSADWAMIAICNSPIGVDLEIEQGRINYRAIASQVLSQAEEVAYKSIPAVEHAETILQLWVCKEATLKAMGLGIAEGLKKVAFSLPLPQQPFHPKVIDPTLQLHIDDDGSCRQSHWTDVESWKVHRLDSAGQSALTTTRQVKTITHCDFRHASLPF